MKTVLVTGANGFLGQALLRRLSTARDVRVVTVGRRPAGPATARRTHRTADLAAPGWTRALPDRVDAVAHLAQSRHHRDFPAKARDLFDVNVRAGFDLLEWCRTRPGVRLVIASTGSFYAPRAGAIRESDRTEPPTFYAATKLALDALARAYAGTVDVALVRLFSLYGPGQEDRLIPNLIERIRRGQPVTLNGPRGIPLAPLHVDDAAAAVATLLTPRPGPGCDVVNLGGAETVSLKDLAAGLARRAGTRAVFQKAPRAHGLVASNRAIERLFGVRPRIPLERGLDQLFSPKEARARS